VWTSHLKDAEISKEFLSATEVQNRVEERVSDVSTISVTRLMQVRVQTYANTAAFYLVQETGTKIQNAQ